MSRFSTKFVSELRVFLEGSIPLDGVSLWYIRRLGRMELGFEQPYIRELFESTGWTVVYKPSTALPLMDFWTARRMENDSIYASPSNAIPVCCWKSSDAQVHTQVGERSDSDGAIRSTGKAGYLVYGPYAALDSGFYEVQWEGCLLGHAATGDVDVVCSGGQEILSSVGFDLPPGFNGGSVGVLAHLGFRLVSPTSSIEFRVRIDDQSLVSASSIVLRKFQAKRTARK